MGTTTHWGGKEKKKRVIRNVAKWSVRKTTGVCLHKDSSLGGNERGAQGGGGWRGKATSGKADGGR